MLKRIPKDGVHTHKTRLEFKPEICWVSQRPRLATLFSFYQTVYWLEENTFSHRSIFQLNFFLHLSRLFETLIRLGQSELFPLIYKEVAFNRYHLLSALLRFCYLTGLEDIVWVMLSSATSLTHLFWMPKVNFRRLDLEYILTSYDHFFLFWLKW